MCKESCPKEPCPLGKEQGEGIFRFSARFPSQCATSGPTISARNWYEPVALRAGERQLKIGAQGGAGQPHGGA